MSINLIGVNATVSENSDGHIIHCVQQIPTAYIDSLRAEKAASMEVREREHQRVASIPQALVDKWIKDGFDFWNETNAKIVAKLKYEGLDYFVTTGKSV